jgi:hypothetical protein
VKYNKLRILSNFHLTVGSHKIVECICDCGRATKVPANKIFSGHTKSCGKCNLVSVEQLLKTKFGKLRINYQFDLKRGSGKKVECICDCGNRFYTEARSVFKNKVNSCIECSKNRIKIVLSNKGKRKFIRRKMISASELSEKKFHKLRIKTPENVSPGSSKEVEWVCDCGRDVLISVNHVLGGDVKSCGKCNIISSDKLSKMKFGKLVMKIPIDTKPYSNKEVEWVCDCGKSCLKPISSVISGHTKSCGKCNVMSSDEMSKRVFGSLRMLEAFDVKPGSNKYVKWVCDCGKITTKKVNHVTSGAITKCGKCRETICDWYFRNETLIRSLKCPVYPHQIPEGGVIINEIIYKSNQPIKTKCPACKKDWNPAWNHVKAGESLTCGCVSNKISKVNMEISNFIKSRGFNVEMEHDVQNLKYDIFVPEKNFLIEYNGDWWHSFPGSKERDARKISVALNNGYKILVLNDNDWLKNRQETEEKLLYYMT